VAGIGEEDRGRLARNPAADDSDTQAGHVQRMTDVTAAVKALDNLLVIVA